MTTTPSERDYFTTLDECPTPRPCFRTPPRWWTRPKGPAVPRVCFDCGRPAYYDMSDDSYRHAVDPARGCFLIPADDRDDDHAHPLVAAAVADLGETPEGVDHAAWVEQRLADTDW